MSIGRVDTQERGRRIVPLGRGKGVVEVEVMPRIQAAKAIAAQTANGEGPCTPTDALRHIATLLGHAERHASAA